MTISTEDAFKQLEELHRNRYQIAKDQHDALVADVKSKRTLRTELQSVVTKANELLALTRGQGLGIGVSEQETEQASVRLSEVSSALETLEAKLKDTPPPRLHDDGMRWQLKQTIVAQELNTVEVVSNWDEIWRTLPVEIHADAHAHPKSVTQKLPRGISVTLSILNGENHYVRGAIPEALRWANPLNPTQSEKLKVAEVYLCDGVRLGLWSTKFYRRVRVPYPRYGESDTTTEEIDYSDEADDLGLIYQEIIGKADGALDLAADYSDNAALAVLQAKVLDLCSTDSKFKRVTTLTTDAVAQAIRQSWMEFTNAPWNSSIVGPLAILKHGLEGKMRARFWCNEYKGNYCYVFRTRDHNWIRGRIWIDPQCRGGSDVIAGTYDYHRGFCTARIGSMVLTAEITDV